MQRDGAVIKVSELVGLPETSFSQEGHGSVGTPMSRLTEAQSSFVRWWARQELIRMGIPIPPLILYDDAANKVARARPMRSVARTPVHSFDDAHTQQPSGLFGAPISRALERGAVVTEGEHGWRIPCIVHDAVQRLRECMHTEGLLRISGSKKRIDALRAEVDEGGPSSCLAAALPHDVATFLKSYLRDLPDPLLTYALNDAFRSAICIPATHEGREQAVLMLVLLLPIERQAVVRYLGHFASDLASAEQYNRMGLANIGMVLAPSYMRSRDAAAPPMADDVQRQIDVMQYLICLHAQLGIAPADIAARARTGTPLYQQLLWMPHAASAGRTLLKRLTVHGADSDASADRSAATGSTASPGAPAEQPKRRRTSSIGEAVALGLAWLRNAATRGTAPVAAAAAATATADGDAAVSAATTAPLTMTMPVAQLEQLRRDQRITARRIADVRRGPAALRHRVGAMPAAAGGGGGGGGADGSAGSDPTDPAPARSAARPAALVVGEPLVVARLRIVTPTLVGLSLVDGPTAATAATATAMMPMPTPTSTAAAITTTGAAAAAAVAVIVAAPATGRENSTDNHGAPGVSDARSAAATSTAVTAVASAPLRRRWSLRRFSLIGARDAGTVQLQLQQQPQQQQQQQQPDPAPPSGKQWSTAAAADGPAPVSERSGASATLCYYVSNV